MQNPQPPPPVKSRLTTDAQPETLDSSGRGPSGPFDKEAGGRDELATNGFSWMERRLPPPFQPCRERGRVIAAGSRSPRLHRGPTALLRARSRATLKRRRNGNEDALSSEGPKAGLSRRERTEVFFPFWARSWPIRQQREVISVARGNQRVLSGDQSSNAGEPAGRDRTLNGGEEASAAQSAGREFS